MGGCQALGSGVLGLLAQVGSWLSPAGFPVEELLPAIRYQADRGLDNYFYPEYAMYVQEPQKVAGTFMERANACQVNVSAAARSLEDYYLYFPNYAAMTALD